MISLDTAAVFFAASLAMAFAPGPDNIFVLTQSALYGRKAGLWVTLGLCTGLLFHTAAVSFGIAAIFKTSVVAFNILKITGACYLLYLAWKSFRAKTAVKEKTKDIKVEKHKLFSRGIIMNITNPKVGIFFLAFLPQFVEPDQGSIKIQMLILGTLFIVSTLFVFNVFAWFAGYIGELFQKSSKVQLIMNRVAGTVFTGLALKLLVSEK